VTAPTSTGSYSDDNVGGGGSQVVDNDSSSPSVSTGSYLDNLGIGGYGTLRGTPASTPVSTGSYLDNNVGVSRVSGCTLESAPASSANYLDNLGRGGNETLGDTSTSASASNESCLSDNIRGGGSRGSGSASASTSASTGSYLDSIGGGAATKISADTSTSSQALTGSYLDKLGEGGSPISGGAMASAPGSTDSYLQAISEDCNVDSPSAECGAAIMNYLVALSSGTVAPSPATGAAITSYIDALGRNAPPTPTTMSAPKTSAVAVMSYLDRISSGEINASASAVAVTNYLRSLLTSAVALPSNAECIVTCLDSIADSRTATLDVDISTNTGTLPGASMAPPSPSAPPTKSDFIPVSSSSFHLAIWQDCNADAPSAECGAAISNYLEAVSTGTTTLSLAAEAAITSYLDALSGKASSKDIPPLR